MGKFCTLKKGRFCIHLRGKFCIQDGRVKILQARQQEKISTRR